MHETPGICIVYTNIYTINNVVVYWLLTSYMEINQWCNLLI